MRILQIDDNQSITDVFAKVLPLKGHEYQAVNNGIDGVKEILSGNYDVVILDLSMPKFSGLDVINTVKSKGGQLSNIIILTAATLSEKEQETILAFGIRNIVLKPVTLTKLLEQLTEFNQRMIVEKKNQT